MIKLLIFTQTFPPEKTGGASRLWDMACHMHKAGAEITVVCPHPTFPYGNFSKVSKRKIEYDSDGIRVVNLWAWQPQGSRPSPVAKILYYLSYPVHAVFWALKHYKEYDAVLTTTPPLFVHIPGYIVRKFHHCLWIAEFRDLWIDASIELGFLKKRSLQERMSRSFQTKCLKKADKIAVTTNEMGRRLVVDDVLKKKLTLVPNGVDSAIFKPVPFEEKVNQIVFAGNIGYAQDLEMVIRSLKIINREHPLVLNLIGDGEIVGHLHDVAEEEGVEELVLFTGLVERSAVPSMIAHAKIVSSPLKDIPSLEYAAPIKVYEAMACGTPIIGCGKGEIAELLSVSGAGMIAHNTPEAYAEAVLSLLMNPDKMKQMGENGRKYAMKYYERKTIALHLLNEIENMASQSKYAHIRR